MYKRHESKRAGVKKFNYISVISCDEPGAEKVPMLHAKYLFEEELKKFLNNLISPCEFNINFYSKFYNLNNYEDQKAERTLRELQCGGFYALRWLCCV